MITQQEINDWANSLPPGGKVFVEALFDWAYRAGAKDALARVQGKINELNTAFPDPQEIKHEN